MVKIQVNSQGKAYYTSGGKVLMKPVAVVESLNVVPSTSAQTITAPSGTDGYSPINVSAVTSSIDNNIVASNIVSGVSILGVNGSATVLNGETVNITPSTSAQIITPTSPKNGITQANVAAVTASIDSNITAENIKKDVQILGVTGTYEGSGGGSSTPAERTVKANYWVDTSGVVHNLEDRNDVVLSANATSITTQSFRNKYKGITTIAKVDLSAIESIFEQQAFLSAFEVTTGTGNITEVDLSGLKTISGADAMARTFMQNSITKVDISSLESMSGDETFYLAFSGNPVEDIRFPSHPIDISGKWAFMGTFQNHNLSGVLDLSWIHSISGESALSNTFASDTTKVSGITSVDLSGLISVTGDYAVSGIFQNLSDVNGDIINISNLETVTCSYGIRDLVEGASGDYVFPKLSNVNGDKILYKGFNSSSNLTSVSFPALTTTSFGSYTSQFNQMLRNDSNVTVHFPSNLQAVIGSWSDVTAGFGGTNTTVLFDLPATS